MLEFANLLIIFVFIIEAIICFFAFKLIDKVLDDKSKSMEVAKRRTIHVLILVAAIYFNPLVAFVISLVKYPRISCFILLFILLGTFWVTPKIIIPLSEKMHEHIVDDVYGKDSEYAQFIHEKYEQKVIEEKILKV